MTKLKILIIGCLAVLPLIAADVRAQSYPDEMKRTLPGVTLSAKLIDSEQNAQKKTAIVEVDVKGIKLIDPAKATRKPEAREAHLHYQVDGGYTIATPAPKLSFHGLSSGVHQITVSLADNDHAPLGPRETLTVTIP